jgi:signal transduction histidine kinase
LAAFIRRHSDAIVAEWESFAATMRPAARNMTRAELRDHAAELLRAAADDLDHEQSPEQQRQKARGRGTARRMAIVAQNHGIQRLHAGFRLAQVLAEYRALRANVARLWEDALPRPTATTRRDLIRFNEAIDEALTEAINRYAAQVDEYRDQFIAVLGHDLQNPLMAISMSAMLLAGAEDVDDRDGAPARRVMIASARMSRMVRDLLDVTRTRLGERLAISRQPTDLGALCRQVVDELEAAHPGRRLVLESSGDLGGAWDSGRLAQIISNLVANALQYGDATKPVTIRALPADGNAVLTVHNYGPAMSAASLKTMFDRTVRPSRSRHSAGGTSNLGLGLFIVRELVKAHGGTVRVTSTDAGGTTFSVTLPLRERSERKSARAAGRTALLPQRPERRP